MKFISNVSIMFIVPFLFLILGQGDACRSKMTNIPEKKGDRISAGLWGGNHVTLEVTDSGANVEFDCANGSLSQPIILDDHGNFSVAGTYVAESHGPTRANAESLDKSARYSGSVSGNVMTLTVKLGDAAVTNGPYTLTQGRQGKLWKCG
jgi:hypothetical protein